MGYAKRTDSNQQAIMDCFRSLGYSVKDTSAIGEGFPDLLISKGENLLVECKTIDGKPNDLQIKFIMKWNSAVYIVRDVDDCISLDAGNLQPYNISKKEIKRIVQNQN